MDNDLPLIGTRLGQLVVVVGGALGLWASFAITIASISATSAPQFALRAWPWSSSAWATLASQQINTGHIVSRSNALRAAIEARKASQRSIVNATAAQSYGASMLFLGKPDAARAAITFSEVLTRRNLAAQLWLIEDAVAHDDITQALVHYDRALRVSIKARALLFPILIAAAEQPQVRTALASTLSHRPSWWAAFISQEIGQAATPEALIPLILSLKLSDREPSQAQIIGAALDRLAAWGRFEDAWRLQQSYRSGGAGMSVVADGGFEDAKSFGPFTWRFADSGDPVATIEMREGGHALFLSAQSQQGEVARQVVRVAPGDAILSIRAGGFHDDENAIIDLRCATADIGLIQGKVATAADDGARTSFPFKVDQFCRYAVLTLSYHGGDHDSSAWVDDIQIKRAGQ